MDPTQKLNYATAKLETTKVRIKVLVQKLNAQEMTVELANETQSVLADVREILELSEELQLLAYVTFYDPQVFKFNDEQLMQLDNYS